MLAFLASEPDLARLCLVESQSAGPAVAARFHDAVGELVPPLRLGRAERAGGRELPAVHRGAGDRRPGLPREPQGRRRRSRRVSSELLPDFTEFILSPYLGPDEAERLARQLA